MHVFTLTRSQRVKWTPTGERGVYGMVVKFRKFGLTRFKRGLCPSRTAFGDGFDKTGACASPFH